MNWWVVEGQKEPFLDDINDFIEFNAMVGRRQKQMQTMERQKQENAERRRQDLRSQY